MHPHLLQMAGPVSETVLNGFNLAIAVLVGMVVAVVYTLIAMIRGIQGHPPRQRPAWVEYLTPALVVIGLGVASYLAYIETTFSEAGRTGSRAE